MSPSSPSTTTSSSSVDPRLLPWTSVVSSTTSTSADSLVGEECIIRLCRTLRVPDTGNSNGQGQVQPVPATFKWFPHIQGSKCNPARVPAAMRAKGGLVVPVLRREAMCLRFLIADERRKEIYAVWDSANCYFAVRVFAGAVNAVSGRASVEPVKKGEQKLLCCAIAGAGRWVPERGESG
ncbi:hypothetical protein VTI74DRAFT_309 [Chaetomium olivicolor]